MEDKRLIPVITGCTASGKTEAAFYIARQLPAVEIISADSRQLYRGMNIGTAKPTVEQLKEFPHHMIDVADPDDLLSAMWFAKNAMEIIEDIFKRGATPLVVGGSGLYIMSLAGLMDRLPARNDQLRASLLSLEDTVPGSLHRFLAGLDKDEAAVTGIRDRVRLVRALEITLLSGERSSILKKGGNPDKRFRFVFIEKDNTVLREGIKKRTSEMLSNGLLDEVRGLLERGYNRDPVLGVTIGYSEIIDHLDGLCSIEQAQTAIETHTWQYARKQRNMFRRLPGVVSVSSDPVTVQAALFGERSSDG
ncbi:MAG: tRNA (adenosine(37)-N6)-dimethylallyltransferase MiaA [Candidatus Sabulitectum sp.]|nr:tRNA (adenosine(37)-N6)-dimethylallyltransferase MiaA [Candidatus Sabulitectum sp.]